MKKYIPAFQDSHMISGATQAGFWESRRILGNHVLTEDEYVSAVHFEYAIARVAHPLDMHRSTDSQQNVRFLNEAGYIPYRSMVSDQIHNVIVAGRCISADRRSFASIRVQTTAMALGQAAGTAAALSVRQGCSVSRVDVPELRALLAEQGADI